MSQFRYFDSSHLTAAPRKMCLCKSFKRQAVTSWGQIGGHRSLSVMVPSEGGHQGQRWGLLKLVNMSIDLCLPVSLCVLEKYTIKGGDRGTERISFFSFYF